MEVLTYIIVVLGLSMMAVLYWCLSDIKIELRYKNTLLKEQNEILKNQTNND